MDKNKVISFLESSFLSSLLIDEDVTDISYNGDSIYYVSNSLGRKKAPLLVEHQTIKDFLRQIANLTENQFSFSNPKLDTSFGKYRLHATHQSIGRLNDEQRVTFSLRIASSTPRINDNSDFFTPDIVKLIKWLIANRKSIVIGGITGSGKTEFQKYLIRNMPENERVIVIDNVMELDQVRLDSSIDMTCWQVNLDNPNASPSSLIKDALRNNPDWLIVAEARGEEMADVLNSAMTGAPIITTIHSYDVKSLPSRMGRLMQYSKQKIDYKEALNDIYYHFHYYFYLVKEVVNGNVKRYISQVCYFSNDGEYKLLFDKKKNINLLKGGHYE